MKTVLPRQEFSDAISAALHLISARTPREILKCVKLSVAQDVLTLSATDGETGLLMRVPVLSVDKPADVVVPAERLGPVIREMSDLEITLEADEHYCTIRGEGSEIRLFVKDAADFPPVASFDDEADLVVDGRELARMISLTVYAAARETSRYAINGVLWQKRDKQLFLVATDGRRLARAGGEPAESNSADFEAILPAKTMAVYERVLGAHDGDEGIRIRFTPNQVLLAASDRVLSSVLLEGTFPKYEDVIPAEHDKRAKLNREEFLSAVRRASLLTDDESRAVKLSFGDDKLVITSQTPEQGDARIEVPVEYEGEPLAIGFNPAFLTEALRAMSYDEVVFELHEPFKPGVLSGGNREEFLYVVMPVSLSQ